MEKKSQGIISCMPFVVVFCTMIAILITSCTETELQNTGPEGNSDVTSPVIVSVQPAGNATSVEPGTNPSVTFSEPMNAATLNSTSFTLKKGSTGLPGTVVCSGSTATLDPAAALESNTVYTCTVTTSAKDLAGNALALNYSWSFTTAAGTVTPKSFAADVVPILNKCNTCHKHNWTPSSTPSVFHANLVSSGHINLTTPVSGKIYVKLNGGHPPSTITSEEKTTVLTWIKEGSKNN